MTNLSYGPNFCLTILDIALVSRQALNSCWAMLYVALILYASNRPITWEKFLYAQGEETFRPWTFISFNTTNKIASNYLREIIVCQGGRIFCPWTFLSFNINKVGIQLILSFNNISKVGIQQTNINICFFLSRNINICWTVYMRMEKENLSR